MGRRPSAGVPTIRLHKPTGRARVFIHGRYHWLGRYGSPEAQQRYAELLGAAAAKQEEERPTPPPPAPGTITVAELFLAWLKSVEEARGTKCSTYIGGVVAARAVMPWAKLPAKDFGPARLMDARERFAAEPVIRHDGHGLVASTTARSRRYVNDVTARIVQAFRWGVIRELVPGNQAAALREVPALRIGDSKAVRETERRTPVPADDLAASLPHLSPVALQVVWFMLHTGCRPGEACGLRMADIVDRDKPVWRGRPKQHKNAWRGHSRDIAIGPKAQAVIVEALGSRPDDAPIFATHGRGRTISITPRAMTVHALRQAIGKACEAAGVSRWTPYQLRYCRADEVRKSHGRDAAAGILGDRCAAMADHYASDRWPAIAAAAAASG